VRPRRPRRAPPPRATGAASGRVEAPAPRESKQGGGGGSGGCGGGGGCGAVVPVGAAKQPGGRGGGNRVGSARAPAARARRRAVRALGWLAVAAIGGAALSLLTVERRAGGGRAAVAGIGRPQRQRPGSTRKTVPKNRLI